jgi:hypothetical protein
VALRGKLEFELGKNKWAYGPQNASYSSDSISARVAGVNTYFLDPGMVSRAKRSLERGSDVRSRGFMDGRNFEGKNEEKPDISTSFEPGGSGSDCLACRSKLSGRGYAYKGRRLPELGTYM